VTAVVPEVRDVIAPDNVIAWMGGDRHCIGDWIRYGDEETLEAAWSSGETVLIVERERRGGDGYIRDVAGTAPLAALLDLAREVEYHKQDLRELQRQMSEVAKVFAIVGHGLLENAGGIDADTTAAVVRFLRGDRDGGS